MSLQGDRPRVQVLELVVLEDGVTVDTHDACRVLHAHLEQPPPFGLDSWVQLGALERIQRSGRIMGALDVVQLHLIGPPARRGATKHHAAIVMADMPYVHLQLEIAKAVGGRKVTIAVAVQHAAERLEDRLAIRDVPFGQIFSRFVERRPRNFRRQLAYAQGAKSNWIGQRLQPEVSGAQTVAQFRHGLDVEILNQFLVGPHPQIRPVH